MILILGAMEQEIAQLIIEAQIESSEKWGPFALHIGTLEKRPVCIVKCGVGKVLSAMLAQHLISRFNPDYLLFTGLAGALNPRFDIGDVILGTELIQHDIEAQALGFRRGQIPYTDIFAIPADTRLLQHAKKFKCSEFSIHEGRILTGDQFISSSDQSSHGYLVADLNGDAVDMEGASVATVATLNNIPFLIIRTISDKADGSSPESFAEFLPLASRHASKLITHMLKVS